MMKHTFGVALAAFCIGCLSAAQGDVLGEAKYLWNFDRDITGDGDLQIEEVRDARHWGSTNLSGYAGTWLPNSIKTNGIDKVGPQWRTGTVIQPTRGITSEGTYLHFSVGTNTVANADGTCVTNVSGCGIEYNTGAITGSVTVLLRLRVDTFDAWCNAEDFVWVVDNGENWHDDAKQATGSNFGFYAEKSVKGRGRPSVMVGKNELRMKASVKTNVWYDIGISLRDTGDGGAEAFFMIRDPDAPKAVNDGKGYTTKGVVFERIPLSAKSGAFMNEANAKSFIRIGGEEIGYVGKKNGSNTRKCFAGDIQRIVMWDRALTTNELVEAALQTSSLFKIGYEDGANGEFGRVDEIVKPYDVDRAPFHEMPQTLSAAHPVAELVFTPYSKSAAGLGHMMRIKAAAGEEGTTVLRVSVNGHVADTLALSAGKEKWFYVKPGWLNETANAIRIERLATSTATSFNFDVVEMSGSWQISETGNGNNDMSHEDGVPDVFYVGDWNFHGMQRGVSTGRSRVAIRFQMPAALALRHAFTYSGVCTAIDSSGEKNYLVLTNSVANGGLGYPYRKWPLNVAVNGHEYVTEKCIGNGEGWSFTIPKGTLNAGWNEVTVKLAVPADKAACWTCFDYLRFEIEPNPSHTLLIFR